MRAYPSSLSSTPALTDESTLDSAVDCLTEHLPISMDGSYTVREVFEVLIRAASRGDSIEHTVRTLTGAPCGNGIRYHLEKFEDMAMLEEQLNGALHSRIPPKVAKGRHRVILDLHLIPDYGVPSEADASYVYRSQAKAGTTRCFAYATVYVICRNKRVTLGIHAVPCDETLVATVTYLLASSMSCIKSKSPCISFMTTIANALALKPVTELKTTVGFALPLKIQSSDFCLWRWRLS